MMFCLLATFELGLFACAHKDQEIAFSEPNDESRQGRQLVSFAFGSCSFKKCG
jgi:hypothetical protein